jgi:hypothetical protein
MGKRGPAPWAPTDDERARVKAYAAGGATQEVIAKLLNRSVDSLDRYCRDELDDGQAEIVATIASIVVKKALNGDNGCCFFILKTRGGFSEKSAIELTGAGGGAVKFEQVRSDADAFLSRIAGLVARLGPPDGTGTPIA